MHDEDVLIAANITLMLREQDVDFLLRAVAEYSPKNDEDAHERSYLLDVLETIALSE